MERGGIMLKMIITVILGVGFACADAHAMITTVYDQFDDRMLDPTWSIRFQNSGGWSFNESGNDLTFTDIIPTVINKGDGGTWAKVMLSRTFTPLDNFDVDFDFSWNSAGSPLPMQSVSINLYDSIGNQIALAEYFDAWVQSRGEKYAIAGENSFYSGYNTLPFDGTASVDILRFGNNINVLWDGASLVTGRSKYPLSRIDLEFRYYAYDGWAGTSFFGSESIDLVEIKGDKIIRSPVPDDSATIFLLGIGIAGLAATKIMRASSKTFMEA
jgi:hypothetical protein